MFDNWSLTFTNSPLAIEAEIWISLSEVTLAVESPEIFSVGLSKGWKYPE